MHPVCGQLDRDCCAGELREVPASGQAEEATAHRPALRQSPCGRDGSLPLGRCKGSLTLSLVDDSIPQPESRYSAAYSLVSGFLVDFPSKRQVVDPRLPCDGGLACTHARSTEYCSVRVVEDQSLLATLFIRSTC